MNIVSCFKQDNNVVETNGKMGWAKSDEEKIIGRR
jgi:hypothetical protein